MSSNSGATLTLDDTTAISGGTITIDTGGKLVMDGTGLGDTISGSIIDVSGTLTMSGTDQILGGSIVIDGKLNADGTDTISGTTITVDSGGLLNTDGTVTLGDDTVTNDQAAGIVVSGGSLTLNSGTTITNTLTADSIVVELWGDADAGRHHGDLRRHHHHRYRRQAGHGRHRPRRHHLGQHHRRQRHADHERDRPDPGRQHRH